jgi:hypothetical protein
MFATAAEKSKFLQTLFANTSLATNAEAKAASVSVRTVTRTKASPFRHYA